MKRYRARVFIPIVYEIEAENEHQATQIAVECYKKENKTEKIAFLSVSWAHPEVEVEEMPTV
jgi:hypothetical protein